MNSYLVPFDRPKSVFPMGTLYVTRGATESFVIVEIHLALARHSQGDWGDLSEADRQANDLALKEGTRLLSAYRYGRKKLWVITESDRRSTTVLLPSEY